MKLWRPLLILAAVSQLFVCGTSEKKTTKTTADVVDCNYHLSNQNVHVCIKDMPRKECEELFAAPNLEREKECVCNQPGRKAEQVKGVGYVQTNCK